MGTKRDEGITHAGGKSLVEIGVLWKYSRLPYADPEWTLNLAPIGLLRCVPSP